MVQSAQCILRLKLCEARMSGAIRWLAKTGNGRTLQRSAVVDSKQSKLVLGGDSGELNATETIVPDNNYLRRTAEVCLMS